MICMWFFQNLRKPVLLLVLCTILSCSALSHGGHTDSNGGHYDHSTGEYHYHHGYPAHQHTGGICSYDFDDQTGVSSGPSSSGNSTGKNTVPKATAPSPKKYIEDTFHAPQPDSDISNAATKQVPWWKTALKIISIIFITFPILYPLLFFICASVFSFFRKIFPRFRKSR